MVKEESNADVSLPSELTSATSSGEESELEYEEEEEEEEGA